MSIIPIQKIARREIIIPKGHNVDYGTPVEVMVAQGGGKVIEAGYANMCTPEHVSMMITEKLLRFYIKVIMQFRKYADGGRNGRSCQSSSFAIDR